MTTIFVTHDQEEAMEISDHVVIMNKGKVEQIGTPAEIYDRPASEFVMRFIGETNIISSAKRHFPYLEISDRDRVFLRPHDLLIQAEPETNFAPAIVSSAFNLGWEGQAELVLKDDQKLIVKLERDRFDSLDLHPQKEVYVKPLKTRVFAEAI